MNWIRVENEMPVDYEEVVFTDGKEWYAGWVKDSYDHVNDKRIYPVWHSIETQGLVRGVTHWMRVNLPEGRW